MLKAEIDVTAAEEALKHVAASMRNATPLMKAIAGIMGNAVEENFIREGRPKWLGLKPSTLQQRIGQQLKPGRGVFKSGAWSIALGQRAMQGAKILQHSGRLAASIQQTWDGSTAQVGTNVVYARIHNFGGTTKAHTIEPKNKKALAFNGHIVKRVNHPGSVIPARPFLMLTDSDIAQVEDVVQDYLRDMAGI